MPDIFGTQHASDFEHYQARLQARGLPGTDENYGAMLFDAAPLNGVPHDFNALGQFRSIDTSLMTDAEVNAQALQFMQSNLEAVQAQVERILYTETRFDRWIPVKTDIPEGATAYSYRIMDRHGRAQRIDRSGTDAPTVGVTQRKEIFTFDYHGLTGEYTLEDMRNAMFQGVPLDSEIVTAMAEGFLDTVEETALTGIKDVSTSYGLLNQANVTATAAPKQIVNMDDTEMLAWLNKWPVMILEDTNEVIGKRIKAVLNIGMPYSAINALTTTPRSDNSDKTVWQYFKENNLWTDVTGMSVMLHPILETKDAAANGSDDRAIIWLNDSRMMELAMPIPPRITRFKQELYGTKVAMEGKFSGLHRKRANGIYYEDGI